MQSCSGFSDARPAAARYLEQHPRTCARDPARARAGRPSLSARGRSGTSGRRPGRGCGMRIRASSRSRSRPSPPTTSCSSSAGSASSPPGESPSPTASGCRRRWSRCSPSTSRAASGRRPPAPSRCGGPRRHRHADRPHVDLRRGGALGDLGCDRLRRQPRLGGRGRRTAPVADPVRSPARVAAAPARLSAAEPLGDEAVRGRRDRAAAIPGHDRTARSSTAGRGWSAVSGCGSCCAASTRPRPCRRSRSSAASPRSGRSSPYSRSSRRRGSAFARRRCTASCLRSRAPGRRSARRC